MVKLKYFTAMLHLVSGLLCAQWRRVSFAGYSAGYSPDEVNRINKHLLFEMPDVQTEVGLVLGAGTVSAYVAEDAARLYHEGKFKKVIICGGLKPAKDLLRHFVFDDVQNDGLELPYQDETEADYMKRIMLKRGVPESVMHIDTKSANSGENIEHALKLGLGEEKSSTIVTLAYHQRRGMATLRKHLSEEQHAITTHAVYPFGLTKDTWMQDWRADYAITDECKKIGPFDDEYVRKNFCVEIDPARESALWAKLSGVAIVLASGISTAMDQLRF